MDEFFQRLNQPMRQNNPYLVNPCDTGAMYVVQSIPGNSINLFAQQLQQLQQVQATQSIGNRRRKRGIKKSHDVKLVSEIFEGQSFPYRLWHLINDTEFDDVLHWSSDGNYIVFPSEDLFVMKVLLKREERIFKTESMKSFVRQLNLYGFTKVQVDKDETFLELKRKQDLPWPELVFIHQFFKQGRFDLLEKIQRRCNVKERKRKQELKENGGEYVVSNFDVGSPAMALAERKRALLMQYPTQFSQVTQQEVLAQYPNIVPSHDRGLDREEAKRKLTFNEEKEPVKQNSSPFAIYGYQQGVMNNTFQPILAPQTWPNLENHANQTIMQQIQQITKEGSTCINQAKSFEDAQQLENEKAASAVEVESVKSNEQEERVAESDDFSPLAAFCASLFRPSASESLFDCQNLE